MCSYMPFCKWAWFIDFFGRGGILAYMNSSRIGWAAILNAPFANFRTSSSKKSINFWFVGLKNNRQKLCFVVAFDWALTYFLRNIIRISAKISRFRLLMFLNVCGASPRMREWKYFILSSSVSWFLDFCLVWNRSANSSIFSDFPWKMGNCCREKLGRFEILLVLLCKMAELLLLANCWGANKIWTALIA